MYYNKVKIGEAAWLNTKNVIVLAKSDGQACVKPNSGPMQIVRGDALEAPKNMEWLDEFPCAKAFNSLAYIKMTMDGWRLFDGPGMTSVIMRDSLFRMPFVDRTAWMNWSITIQALKAHQHDMQMNSM